MEKLTISIENLRVQRGRRVTYYATCDIDGVEYGYGFDDAHLYDAFNDQEDTSYYDDVQMSMAKHILNANWVEFDTIVIN